MLSCKRLRHTRTASGSCGSSYEPRTGSLRKSTPQQRASGDTHTASGRSGSGGSVSRRARTACRERWSSFSQASTTAVQPCTPPRGWRSQPRHAFTPCRPRMQAFRCSGRRSGSGPRLDICYICHSCRRSARQGLYGALQYQVLEQNFVVSGLPDASPT